MLTAEIDLRYLETQHERGQLTVDECLEFCRAMKARAEAAEEEAAGIRDELQSDIDGYKEERDEVVRQMEMLEEAARKGEPAARIVYQCQQREAAAERVRRLAVNALRRVQQAATTGARELGGDRLTIKTRRAARNELAWAAEVATKTLEEIDLVRQEAEREGDGAGADPGVTPAAGVVPAVGAVG